MSVKFAEVLAEMVTRLRHSNQEPYVAIFRRHVSPHRLRDRLDAACSKQVYNHLGKFRRRIVKPLLVNTDTQPTIQFERIWNASFEAMPRRLVVQPPSLETRTLYKSVTDTVYDMPGCDQEPSSPHFNDKA